jgi:hypothetical protein
MGQKTSQQTILFGKTNEIVATRMCCKAMTCLPSKNTKNVAMESPSTINLGITWNYSIHEHFPLQHLIAAAIILLYRAKNVLIRQALQTPYSTT